MRHPFFGNVTDHKRYVNFAKRGFVALFQQIDVKIKGAVKAISALPIFTFASLWPISQLGIFIWLPQALDFARTQVDILEFNPLNKLSVFLRSDRYFIALLCHIIKPLTEKCRPYLQQLFG